MAKQSETKVITNPVRLSYVNLFEPKAFEGQDAKYSVMLLIPKSDKDTLKAIKAAQQVAYDGAKSDKLKGVKPNMLKTTLRDGDEEMDTDERPEYKGMMFINVSAKTKPGVVDAHREEITDQAEVYSGMWGRVSINFYAYNTAGNKGISAGLNNVQKTKDDESLGGRSRAEDDFDDWDTDDDDEEADDGLLE